MSNPDAISMRGHAVGRRLMDEGLRLVPVVERGVLAGPSP
jgi:hypothetical protein